jgi:hypothetical protein
MPMCMVEFRFLQGPPSREALRRDLQHELGPRGERRFDAIELEGDTISALGMDIIGLLYMAKVCQARGGVAVTGRNEPARILIPTWARVPWTQHGWLKRFAIRFGRISLAPVPVEERP